MAEVLVVSVVVAVNLRGAVEGRPAALSPALLATLLTVDWRALLVRRRPAHGGPTLQKPS